MLKFVTFLALCCMVFNVHADELPPEIKAMLKNLHDMCIAESGASESDIADFNQGKHNPVDSLKCYMKCLMVQLGVLDDDGVFDTEAYVDLLPPHMTEFGKKVEANCKIEGNGACDIAYNFNVCSYNTDSKIYMLF